MSETNVPGMVLKNVRKKTPNIDNEQFVEEIRKHQFLFNPFDVDYKDTGKKENRWDNIANLFGITSMLPILFFKLRYFLFIESHW